MNFIKAYTLGLKTIFSKGKLWLLLYALNFLFAIFLAYPLSGFLGTRLGHTLAADTLFERFDYAISNDFINEYGAAFGVILNQSVVGIGLYLLLSVFLVGGILNSLKVKEKTYSLATFWSGGGQYFWRMLRLTIYFLLMQIVVLVAFFMLFSTLTAGGLERFHNEGDIIKRGLIILPLYLLVATIFFMIHDYAKIHVVATDKNLLFQPIRQAFGWVFKNFSQTFLLYLLNLLTFGLLFFIYLKLDGGTAIFAVFLIGQFFVLARIGTKLLNLASATELYQDRSNTAL